MTKVQRLKLKTINHMKKILAAGMLLVGLAVHGAMVNPGFEQGFTGWNADFSTPGLPSVISVVDHYNIPGGGVLNPFPDPINPNHNFVMVSSDPSVAGLQ
jgi:hypothetical protein